MLAGKGRIIWSDQGVKISIPAAVSKDSAFPFPHKKNIPVTIKINGKKLEVG